MPIHLACQQLAQPRQHVAVDDRAGALVEAEPDQPLAPFVRHGGVAKGEQQTACPGRLGVMQAPDRVGQIECAVEQALRVARRCDLVGNDKLPLGEAAALAKQGTEAVEPVAFEPDRHRAGGQRGAKSQAAQTPASPWRRAAAPAPALRAHPAPPAR